jgi:hypothetical protein
VQVRMPGRALQASEETGSFVRVAPATRAGLAFLTSRRRTAGAAHRFGMVNAGMRDQSSPGGPRCHPHRSSRIRRMHQLS